MVRKIFFYLSIFVLAPSLVQSQTYVASASGGKQEFRLGGGLQFGFSYYFPGDVNEFIDDIFDSWTEDFGIYLTEKPPLMFGINARLYAKVRVAEMFELRPWIEYFYGGSKKIFFTYSEYGYDYDLHIEDEIIFKPSYIVPGMTFCLTPALAKGIYPQLGVGVGYYMGKLNVKEEGGMDYYDYYTGEYLAEYWSDSHDFKGGTIGFEGVLGIILAPMKNFEIEVSLVGRYAKIKEIKDKDYRDSVYNDGILRNYLRNDKKVSLSFSGIDFRLGGALVF